MLAESLAYLCGFWEGGRVLQSVVQCALLCGAVLSTGVEGRSQLRGSLLHLLDRCSTAAGGRSLRRWLAAPLADMAAILDRQQAVQVGHVD